MAIHERTSDNLKLPPPFTAGRSSPQLLDRLEVDMKVLEKAIQSGHMPINGRTWYPPALQAEQRENHSRFGTIFFNP